MIGRIHISYSQNHLQHKKKLSSSTMKSTASDKQTNVSLAEWHPIALDEGYTIYTLHSKRNINICYFPSKFQRNKVPVINVPHCCLAKEKFVKCLIMTEGEIPNLILQKYYWHYCNNHIFNLNIRGVYYQNITDITTTIIFST